MKFILLLLSLSSCNFDFSSPRYEDQSPFDFAQMKSEELSLTRIWNFTQVNLKYYNEHYDRITNPESLKERYLTFIEGELLSYARIHKLTETQEEEVLGLKDEIEELFTLIESDKKQKTWNQELIDFKNSVDAYTLELKS